MKTPIIELRHASLWVLRHFDGVVEDGRARRRHAFGGDRVRHVVDANGDLWSFDFAGTDHAGLRKWFSTVVWNVSTDAFRVVRDPGMTVARFRELVGPHCGHVDPGQREMAEALLESVAACAETDALRHHIALLNL
jgi:hypothetical protein